jgi:hypothetical protein
VGLGSRLRIPFLLSQADIDCRVILLTELPVVRLSLETPDGDIVNEGNASAAGVKFDSEGNVMTARFGLPIVVESAEAQAGTWYAVLEVDEDVEKWLVELSERRQRNDQIDIEALRGRGAPYCLSVHSFSNLRMVAPIGQSGFSPGSTLSLRAVLTEYSLPVQKRASVIVEVEYPDHSHRVVVLEEQDPGAFTASMVAPIAGIYRLRIVAQGGTIRGVPFTRERLGTAAVWTGGDRPTDKPAKGQWCDLLACLLDEKNLSPRLQARLKDQGVNLSSLRECLEAYCRRADTSKG